VREHTGNTDKTTQVKLPSTIEQVLWTEPVAAPGAVVGLEVFTRYVGNGADLQIELSDQRGSKHGTFKEKIAAGRFWASIRVPPGAKDALFADVKLPKHGLSQRSPALLVLPPVEVANAKWDRQETFHGALHKLVADVKGLPDGAEVDVSVWEHDDEGAHELVTRFPALVRGGKVEAEWEFAYHGGAAGLLAWLAGRAEGVPQYFFKVGAHGVSAQSERLKLNWLLIELVGEDDAPIPGERYVVELPDGTKREGALDAHGRAVILDIEKPGSCKVSFPDLDKEAWEEA
jgi:hypothetical protein